eukprot:gnl/Spiro4/15939_TR8567_c0_g1_i1.p1 gnl/Spiro4/15939_TR8567_c0_g1~~gnl/Spiro4/15939_TR8567_c0_g1_i1.p1  ORF type:complete len:413 (-),score=89.30 gnl/Spiro4/15939_TR8567_c0_g1_i1:2-1201(-)
MSFIPYARLLFLIAILSFGQVLSKHRRHRRRSHPISCKFETEFYASIKCLPDGSQQELMVADHMLPWVDTTKLPTAVDVFAKGQDFLLPTLVLLSYLHYDIQEQFFHASKAYANFSSDDAKLVLNAQYCRCAEVIKSAGWTGDGGTYTILEVAKGARSIVPDMVRSALPSSVLEKVDKVEDYFPALDTLTSGGLMTHRCNDDYCQLEIAFRGTRSLADWITNIGAVPKDLPWMDGCVSKLPLSQSTGPCKAHWGFLSAYETVSAKIASQIAEISKKKKSLHVRIGGHSLGGALATVCATHVLSLLSDGMQQNAIHLETLGSPRVLYDDAASVLEAGLGSANIVRLVNRHSDKVVEIDQVTEVPPAPSGFAHTRDPCYLRAPVGQPVDIVFEKLAGPPVL